jgi:peptide deformylase
MGLIIELGDPCLRKPAQPVTDVHSPQLRVVIETMAKALKKEKGVGIAAPQVGVSQQLFIVANNQVVQPPYTSLNTGLVVINPTLSILTDDTTYEWEGCLSIPGIRGYIPRQCHIMVEYMTIHGDRVSNTYDGFTARIFLHEYDHLIGRVFLDHVEDMQHHIITDAYYTKMMEDEA